ncbi:MAG: hypothetical protein KME55_36065 [Nostoc indistinguendum CM1-VF10]|jgi:hypothetical protein|nr:hypothetical protein [Nostoc indistinguendum CM1-VF10]
MAQPPAGHETIVSMVYIIQNPEIDFWGRNRPKAYCQNIPKSTSRVHNDSRLTVIGVSGNDSQTTVIWYSRGVLGVVYGVF